MNKNKYLRKWSLVDQERHLALEVPTLEMDHIGRERENTESASRPLVGFCVLNDNLIKCLISFVEVHDQILSNRYKGIHGYITRSTIMMQMGLSDQCV
jgi:hypothetical protein